MNKKNLANAQLLTGINSSVTTATVKSGQGSVLPEVPFFATLSPVGVLSTIDNSEIVEVTGKSTDTLTIVRGQRGTAAKSFSADALVVNGIYVEDIPTDTTYTEITEAEITTGTASTARTISGRRAQSIVNKAQTGVVKSSTTDRLTVSDTAPASPAVGDLWVDMN